MKDIIIQCKFKLKTLPYIVINDCGNVYQIPHYSNKRTKQFREIKLSLNNGCLAYRINGNFYSKNKLNKLSYKHDEIITISKSLYSENNDYF